MSYPLCFAHGNEHIHRPPIQRATLRRRSVHRPSFRRATRHDAALRTPWRLAAQVNSVFNRPTFRMGGRVVDCARLESVCAAMHRGFESLPIRHSAAGRLEPRSAMRGETACAKRWQTQTGMKSAAQRHRPTEGRPRRGGGRNQHSQFEPFRQVALAINPSPSAIYPS